MKNNIISFFVFIFFLMPPTSVSYMLMVFMIFIIYFISSPQNTYKDISIFLLLGIFFSWAINSFGFTEQESILRAIMLCTLFILFPYFNNKTRISIYVPFILISIIVISQMADMFEISSIQRLVQRYYSHNDTIYGQEGLGFNLSMGGRYGGIYRNPNDCGRSLSILFAMYIILSRTIKWNNVRQQYLFDMMSIVFVFLGIFSTGSRTASIIYFITLILFQYENFKKLKGWKRLIFILLFIIFALYIFINILSSENRLVQTSFSLADRENLILSLLELLLSNIVHLFFGYFYHGKLSDLGLGFVGGFDSDIGNYMYYYGILNLGLLIYFIYSIAYQNRSLFKYIAPIFITIISNGLFTSAMASFHIMILLGVFNSVTKQVNNNNINN